MAESLLFISDVAHLLGVESHVLRYWEEELDLHIPRNEFGHRCYEPKHIQLFMQVKELKEQGFQLRAIKNILFSPSSNLIPMPKQTLPVEKPVASAPSSEDKMAQFQAILSRIVSSAIKENNASLTQEVGTKVSERVIKEMDYLMRSQEETLEAHFKNLDQAIRKQQGRKATEETGKKKSEKKKKEKEPRRKFARKEVAVTKTDIGSRQESNRQKNSRQDNSRQESKALTKKKKK